MASVNNQNQNSAVNDSNTSPFLPPEKSKDLLLTQSFTDTRKDPRFTETTDQLTKSTDQNIPEDDARNGATVSFVPAGQSIGLSSLLSSQRAEEQRVIPEAQIVEFPVDWRSKGSKEGPLEIKDKEFLRSYDGLTAYAEGAFGWVFKAHQVFDHRQSGSEARTVAIKVLTSDSKIDIKQFKNEAHIMAILGVHHNIADVFNKGVVTTAKGDFHYLVAPFMRETYADLISRLQKIPKGSARFSAALKQTLQNHFCPACDALVHAHTRKDAVIHKDIKPRNILIDDFRTKVSDWGLASLVDSESYEIAGTVIYMAPEQARGERQLDQRVDVFAMGATLYETITGQSIYAKQLRSGVSFNKFALGIGEGKYTPEPIKEKADFIPKQLELIVNKALEFEPAKRYQSIADLVGDIRNYYEKKPTLASKEYFNKVHYQLHKAKLAYSRNTKGFQAGILLSGVAIVGGVFGFGKWMESRRAAGRAKTIENQLQVVMSGEEIIPGLNRILTTFNNDDHPYVVNEKEIVQNYLDVQNTFVQFKNRAERVLSDTSMRSKSFGKLDSSASLQAREVLEIYGALDDPDWIKKLPDQYLGEKNVREIVLTANSLRKCIAFHHTPIQSSGLRTTKVIASEEDLQFFCNEAEKALRMSDIELKFLGLNKSFSDKWLEAVKNICLYDKVFKIDVTDGADNSAIDYAFRLFDIKIAPNSQQMGFDAYASACKNVIDEGLAEFPDDLTLQIAKIDYKREIERDILGALQVSNKVLSNPNVGLEGELQSYFTKQTTYIAFGRDAVASYKASMASLDHINKISEKYSEYESDRHSILIYKALANYQLADQFAIGLDPELIAGHDDSQMSREELKDKYYQTALSLLEEAEAMNIDKDKFTLYRYKQGILTKQLRYLEAYDVHIKKRAFSDLDVINHTSFENGGLHLMSEDSHLARGLYADAHNDKTLSETAKKERIDLSTELGTYVVEQVKQIQPYLSKEAARELIKSRAVLHVRYTWAHGPMLEILTEIAKDFDLTIDPYMDPNRS